MKRVIMEYEFIEDYVKCTNPNTMLTVLLDYEDYLKMIGKCFHFNGKSIFVLYCGKREYLHRVVMGFPNAQIDHINRNTLDNRKINLRICTNSQNTQNRNKPHNNTSGYKGVSYNKRISKWDARIMANGRKKWLGNHYTAIDAAMAYNKAAQKYHGRYAVLNQVV